MSQSLYKELKRINKNCTIDVFAPLWMRAIVERMDEIDNFIENPFKHGEFNLKKRISISNSLKDKYDFAFILPNSFKSAFVPFFAHIKNRRGFIGESRYFLLNNIRKNKEDFPLMVERYVSLAFDNNEVKTSHDLKDILYPKLNTKPLDKDTIERLKINITRPLMALGCGANYGPSKMWPSEYFAKASMHFIKKGGAVIALGSQKDKETVAKIKNYIDESMHPYFYDVAGNTNLTEALDLISMCKVAICNDSGLMHTVAAADIPQICIFGSTSTNYTPPLSNKAHCIESDEKCHPCFKKTCKFNTYACLKNITPDLVISKLDEIITL